MAKFKFKFESVRKVKEALETKAKKEVAVIDNEIEKEKNAKQILIDETNNMKKNYSKSSMKASELQFYKNYGTITEKKIEKIDDNLQRLDVRREVKMDELIEKKKENKILDKLEENLQIDFNKEQNQLDLKKFDEIATQKFIRRKK